MEKKELELHEIQRASLCILKEIDKICRKENLKYFLAYGTLIGAIRHDGFIPWDDDIDIMMFRDDYNILKKYFETNETYPYRLIERNTCKNYTYGISRITDIHYKYVCKSGLEKDIGMGTFIDIYVLENYGDSINDANSIRKRINFLNSLYGVIINPDNGQKNLKTCIRYFFSSFCHLFGDRVPNMIDRKIGKIIPSNGTTRFIGIPRWDMTKCTTYENNLFDELIEHRFEDGYFFIPKCYDIILKKHYGDYMELPPVEKRIPHHDYMIFLKE